MKLYLNVVVTKDFQFEDTKKYFTYSSKKIAIYNFN